MNAIVYLFLAFTIIPMIELAVIIEVGQRVGTLNTIALLILSGIVGSVLAKQQGFRAWQTLQQDLAAGRVPEYGVLDALLILFGGALLLAPGFITDIIGFLCLIPITRNWFKQFLRSRLEKWIENGNVVIMR